MGELHDTGSSILGLPSKYAGTFNRFRIIHLQSNDVLTVHQLIVQLARTISCGGNLLVNIGPDSHGQIAPIFVERLRALGNWLHTNGEAVYGSRPWIYQNDTDTWFLSMRLSSCKSIFAPGTQVNSATKTFSLPRHSINRRRTKRLYTLFFSLGLPKIAFFSPLSNSIPR